MKGPHLRFSCRWLSVFVALFFSHWISAQNKLQVVDENRQPLVGVYISYGDGLSTTDLDGYFSFPNDITKETVFKFTCIGYQDLSLSLAQIEHGLPYIQMQPNNTILNEVTVIGRTNATELELPYNIRSIKAKQIFENNIQTSADALELSGGAFIQKSQMGGGSPILRGFEANKVLMVVDGVRMNNAIYRNGHLQNAITIDPSILQQAEVIFGPGSLMYGSEALGGVIHFRTRSPLLNLKPGVDKKNKLNLSFRYNSANHEKTLHFDHTVSKRKFGILTSVSFSDYDDLRAGSNRSEKYPNFGLRSSYVSPNQFIDDIVTNENPNVQIGTAYDQFDLMQKYVFSISERIKTEVNLQFSSSGDIPRYDNLSEMLNGTFRYAIWKYGPQKRVLISPKITILSNTGLFDKIVFISSYQKIDEDRVVRNFNSPLLENQNEDVDVFGFTLDLEKSLRPNQKITYGLDYHFNDVESIAWSQDNSSMDPSAETKILSRYPSGGSQLSNGGIYAQHVLHNPDSTLTWITGARVTYQKVNLLYDRDDPFSWPSYFYDGISNSNTALVGITGINYKRGRFIMKASIGNAFRAPNVDDLSKVRVKRDEITVPNPELTSEKVINGEFSIGYSDSKLKIGATAYYTQLKDAIIRENFTLPDGNPIYVINGDSLQVTGNINAQSGTLRGLSLNLEYKFAPSLTLESSLNFIKGQSKDADGNESPLAHIPPTFGYNRLTYRESLFQISLEHKFNAAKKLQDYGGSVDNPDLATPDGALGWQTFGISTQIFPTSRWTVNVGAYNLTDLHYRPFASGLSGAGRHIVVAVKYSIE